MDFSLLSRRGGSLYVEGSVGTGKTTAAAKHLKRLLEAGIPASEILVLLPQRALSEPYREATEGHVGGRVSIMTISGLARRMILRFWPLVAEEAGFDLRRPPTFLTVETAQYFMSRVAGPLLEEGAFAGLSILESRLYSQLLDNLNKAALVGFPPSEISNRLKGAWIGDESYEAVFDDVQRAADRYLALCRKHNLLDFSLQLRLFYRHLWPESACRKYLNGTYRHLIADNVEECVPATHDLLEVWIPHLESALIIFDRGGGHRQFLGADPNSARRFRSCCDNCRDVPENGVSESGLPENGVSENGRGNGAPAVSALGALITNSLKPNGTETAPPSAVQAVRDQIEVIYAQTYPEMIEQVAAKVLKVIQSGTPPEEIAVLASFLPETLRYALSDALSRREIPFFLRRPSRPLSKEPAVKAMLALATLAHPSWRVQLDIRDVAQTLSFSIEELDPVRAYLLAETVYELEESRPRLRPFSSAGGECQERISYRLGERYSKLRQWIEEEAKADPQPLDHVLNRLFGEVLSQEGYGFHDDFEAAALADSLVESARKFRQVIEQAQLEDKVRPVGRAYLKTVRSGVAAAQYVQSWKRGKEDAVLLAPAHTFLMQNRTARHQFWLDVGNTAWHSRIHQPLTHPHVLSRSWEKGKGWTDNDEREAGIAMLRRLVTGLSRRCKESVHLAISRRGQNDQKEQGYMLKAFQQVLGRTSQT